ncbi:MAG: adenylate/guanylate cyclase domain-containing protein, partial [Tepidiformaceae bacterium]
CAWDEEALADALLHEFDEEGGQQANALYTYRELRKEENGLRALVEIQQHGPLALPGLNRTHFLARAIADACLRGDQKQATTMFTEWQERWDDAVLGNFYTPHEALSLATFFVSDLGDDAFWSRVWEQTSDWKNHCSPLSGLALDPVRGQLALRLALVDEAEQCFREGLEWAEREHCPVELGRNLQGLAAVAERRGDVPTALTLLDRAARQYQPRGVKLFLDQVIAAKVRLQGIGSTALHTSIVQVTNAVKAERPDLRQQAAPDGTVTLLFTDIENSTLLNERLGDAKYMEMLRAHNAVIEGQARLHGGHVVKTIGDGFMVAFSSGRRGLDCAIAIQRALAGSAHLDGIRVRMGLHTGEMLKEGDDFFGRHVNLAARVAAAALGGEVVVSDLVRGVVEGQAFNFDDLGERPMKGFEHPLRLWQLRWDGDSGPRHMSRLEIEIDKERQAREVAGIVDTPYFQDLRTQAKNLRQVSNDV